MRTTRNNVLLLLVTCLVFCSGSSTIRHGEPESSLIQPQLFRLAQQDPHQFVSVILRYSTPPGEIKQEVVALGGKITRDFGFINAFAAELPASKLSQLASLPGLLSISIDALVVGSGGSDKPVSPEYLQNAYDLAINADDVWALGYQGSSIAVAVVDSGMDKHKDFKDRILAKQKFTSADVNTNDKYGHGTHIAGIIAGDGKESDGKYIGIAPQAALVNVKISDDEGMSLTSDVIAGLQWIYENRKAYNIRAVNLSINSTVVESYHTSPLDAALEILWFNGIVTIVSSGNNGMGIIYPPANDPFVITVGAVDDRGTADIQDDVLAPFSAIGLTTDGFAKPDLVSPGVNIISTMSKQKCVLNSAHPSNKLQDDTSYFQMSGTSMASAVVAGAVALLLESEPTLNPDQVKYRLMNTARSVGLGAGYVDIYAAVTTKTDQTSNTNLPASQLLWTGSNPVNWGSVNWGSVNWGSVNWGSVNWGSVNWGSVNWGSDFWNN